MSDSETLVSEALIDYAVDLGTKLTGVQKDEYEQRLRAYLKILSVVSKHTEGDPLRAKLNNVVQDE